jgi:hypothetical protein
MSNYIVIKQPKNVGIAILLSVLFGPIGLFYSTISGGLIMTFIWPLILLFLIASGFLSSLTGDLSTGILFFTSAVILYIIGAWIISIVWAIVACNRYNQEIEEKSNHFFAQSPQPLINNESKQDLYLQLERLTNLYEKGLLTYEEFLNEKNEVKRKIEKIGLVQKEASYQHEYQRTFPKKKHGGVNLFLGICSILLLMVVVYAYYNPNSKTPDDETTISPLAFESSTEEGNHTGQSETSQQYVVTKEEVERNFLKHLKEIGSGRSFNEYFHPDESTGYAVFTADINNDGNIDGIVDYSFTPTYEETGGGNAIGAIDGIALFINTGQSLKFLLHTEDFGGNFGSRNSITSVKDGKINLKGLDYSEEDARCCPSIPTTTKLILRGDKLIEEADIATRK